MARFGDAGHGRHGESTIGGARCDVARHGGARQAALGVAWSGRVRAGELRQVWQVMVGRGRVWRVRPGVVT
jgi:hypothetical protein